MVSLKSLTARSLNYALRYVGAEINPVGTRKLVQAVQFSDVEPWAIKTIEKTQPFTMTSDERISALCHAVRYIVKSNIPGDIVECGVWRGAV